MPRKPSPLRLAGYASDHLAVECWCHSTVLLLPRATVRAGRTASCGAPDCGPPEAA